MLKVLFIKIIFSFIILSISAVNITVSFDEKGRYSNLNILFLLGYLLESKTLFP